MMMGSESVSVSDTTISRHLISKESFFFKKICFTFPFSLHSSPGIVQAWPIKFGTAAEQRSRANRIEDRR